MQVIIYETGKQSKKVSHGLCNTFILRKPSPVKSNIQEEELNI